MKKMIFIAVTFILNVTNIDAQLKFKNHESNPLEVAIAYFVKTDEFEGYYSTGWYVLEPGETKTLLQGNLKYTTYYFYAKDSKGTEWKGGGKYNFIVDLTNAFNIKNADKEYQLTGTTRKYKAFKKVDVGESREYTLTLTEEED
jgi:uncharacterized membrane protein